MLSWTRPKLTDGFVIPWNRDWHSEITLSTAGPQVTTLRQCCSNVNVDLNHKEIVVHADSDPGALGWSLKFCFSNSRWCPAVGPWTTFEEHCLHGYLR